MAAHSYLRIGSQFFFSYREDYSIHLAAMFRDSEVRVECDAKGNVESYEYVLPARLLRERLDVMGITPRLALAELESVANENQMTEYRQWLYASARALSDEDATPDEAPGWVYGMLDERLIVRMLLEIDTPET